MKQTKIQRIVATINAEIATLQAVRDRLAVLDKPTTTRKPSTARAPKPDATTNPAANARLS